VTVNHCCRSGRSAAGRGTSRCPRSDAARGEEVSVSGVVRDKRCRTGAGSVDEKCQLTGGFYARRGPLQKPSTWAPVRRRALERRKRGGERSLTGSPRRQPAGTRSSAA
jgi:hypothetical protein